ncbi:molecular chaperone HtpG [Dysgonomonas sp. PFB1-18]|uniref:molecular chaperone HtpG n=1 Tax=unclassified Dysgonomonas TaxID=2630389 RepID=UPI0024746E11|nr:MULTISPECIES: molecular chaperone HtpG [unclassified Dysgonomonas]MDH6308880.1 molecular chaperone HtpG [Dysgonomonas sp. PF1-14]MDH6338424.1 molecular chaperone HtpG [Dysgonomonas sp. PF1-16]MDH6380129.1 molecular chaperone HtpG [Dysgonomonas sp. PFB1-18]MDH6397252.1 molecular chaperone HtpG [Dysgonomonas sp. PF1-23]
MEQKGKIGVTTENIFPIIKKFLYSDHEIFLRELVSNAVDATQKLKTYASLGEFKGELGHLSVSVKVDKENGTLTISDRGIGMTSEEIDKYINQIAFSSANEFLDKYKNDANSIIGHFGLGFYSSFMVSKKVEIVTKSFKEGAEAVKWSCDGSPEYTIEPAEKEDRGTDIILYIDDENKNFLEKGEIDRLLKKYCRFLSVPVVFGKKTDWKDGKSVETDEDNVINDTNPLWTRKPAELKEEDYKKFYQELYPFSDEPMFWIHLNVDYPFKLTGILYFPQVKSNVDMNRNKIQLYSNQVFVTDSVEGIVPEFLTLMHGVLDSPDIPLNVSRSYLQSDQNVKKISNHITKKVADRLEEIFKNERTQFEDKWDSLKLFVEYGMLTDDKFYERAQKFCLLKNTDGKMFTFDEYKTLISSDQTDKDGNLVYLYANNKDEQYSYIGTAKDKGYDVLLFDGQLDVHMASFLEQKLEKSRFVRVDSDTVENLIQKEDAKETTLTDKQKEELSEAFTSQLPKIDKTEFTVDYKALDAKAQPIQITQNEFMRRMKEMSAMQTGMGFYGEMPNSYNLVLNVEHPFIKKVMADVDGKEKEAVDVYAGENKEIRQLIDLALLANGMLKGEALNNFVKRNMENI